MYLLSTTEQENFKLGFARRHCDFVHGQLKYPTRKCPSARKIRLRDYGEDMNEIGEIMHAL